MIHTVLNHTDKLHLKGSNKYVVLSILSIYYTRKKIKSNKNVKFKIQIQHEMINLNNMMDHILYQIFKSVLNILKNMKHLLIIL